MSKAKRIELLEQEIEQFNYERMKRQEAAQQTQAKLQQELTSIHDGILTRRGEIMGLKRIIEEEEAEKEALGKNDKEEGKGKGKGKGKEINGQKS